jgi:hypothetical protein
MVKKNPDGLQEKPSGAQSRWAELVIFKPLVPRVIGAQPETGEEIEKSLAGVEVTETRQAVLWM